MSRPDITLYTAQTPNGVKISILLEELGLPYKVQKIEFSKNEQKDPWFLEINPNGRIPALSDVYKDGSKINLFESGAIMQYLVDEYDKERKVSFEPGTREHYEMQCWLFFMNAGVGPMQGQSNHFRRYAPEKIEYGQNRYMNETRRLYGVLDKHLADGDKKYLVGDKCTIADIAHWGWVMAAGWAGVEIDEFPSLKAWEERMAQRPGVDKGKDVPTPSKIKELIADKEKADKFMQESGKWVQKGMQDDAKKGQ